MAAITLSTFNSARISTLEKQIASNNKRVNHLVEITSLQHEQHFKAVDPKIDNVSDKLALMLRVNKVHFAKLTNFMEQKFGTAVAISERLIHTAYNNRLSPGALHHEVLLEIIKYVIEIADNSELLSFVHQPSDLFLVETSYVYRPDDNTFVLVLHVPLVAPHNLMPLFEFILLPVHFNFSGNVSVTPEVGADNMIAVLTLSVVSNRLLFRPSNLQQDGGDLFLQREECPPDRLDQDMPQSLVPRRRQ